MKIKYIIFTFFLNASASWANNHEGELLASFLYSKDHDIKYSSFKRMIDKRDKYKDAVLTQLNKYSKNNADTPDELIYLAAYLKDERYINPLSILLNSKNYSEERCIYSCPIVFSLAIYGTYTVYPLPKNYNSNLTAVYDLNADLKRLKSTQLKQEKASNYIKGPGIDSTLRYIESLPYEKVIQIAGPKTKNGLERTAAAYVLQYSTINHSFLNDLYWLAISGLKDASSEYLTAIYSAIYRAELAQQLGIAHNKSVKQTD